MAVNPTGVPPALEWKVSEEGAATNVQVFMTTHSQISISAFKATRVMHEGLCVITEVLNDLCSMCNWVALPEISVGLTLKLSFILGKLQRGLTHQSGQGSNRAQRVQGCSFSSFSNVKLI